MFDCEHFQKDNVISGSESDCHVIFRPVESLKIQTICSARNTKTRTGNGEIALIYQFDAFLVGSRENNVVGAQVLSDKIN